MKFAVLQSFNLIKQIPLILKPRFWTSNGIVSIKNDKRDDFDFEIVNFPYLDGDFDFSYRNL